MYCNHTSPSAFTVLLLAYFRTLCDSPWPAHTSVLTHTQFPFRPVIQHYSVSKCYAFLFQCFGIFHTPPCFLPLLCEGFLTIYSSRAQFVTTKYFLVLIIISNLCLFGVQWHFLNDFITIAFRVFFGHGFYLDSSVNAFRTFMLISSG